MRWIQRRATAAWLLAMSMAAPIACASSTLAALTPEGARVRVSTAADVSQCRSLGDFVASRPSSRGGMPGVWGSAQVRNAAAAKGATDIVFEDDPHADVVGHGYECP